jgi:uncharacterized damage-inducible protein DinB
MNPADASLLARYNAWADGVLLDAVAELPDGAVYRPAGTSFGTMIGILNHIYQVDLIWWANLTGALHGFTSRRDLLHPKLEALIEAQTRFDGQLIDWASGTTPEALAEVTPFRFVSGRAAEMTRAAMLLHVVNHTSYHRGWVCQMFFGLGAKPPETDLSAYLVQ